MGFHTNLFSFMREESSDTPGELASLLASSTPAPDPVKGSLCRGLLVPPAQKPLEGLFLLPPAPCRHW